MQLKEDYCPEKGSGTEMILFPVEQMSRSGAGQETQEALQFPNLALWFFSDHIFLYIVRTATVGFYKHRIWEGRPAGQQRERTN